jgi:hypothetical protein
MKTIYVVLLTIALSLGCGIWIGYLLKECPKLTIPAPDIIKPIRNDSILILTKQIDTLKNQLNLLKLRKHETKIIYVINSIKPDTTNVPAIFREWADRYN